MPPIDPVLAARGRLAYASRQGTNNPEAAIAARRELKEAKLSRAIREAIDSIPPLTVEQRQRIASILIAGRR